MKPASIPCAAERRVLIAALLCGTAGLSAAAPRDAAEPEASARRVQQLTREISPALIKLRRDLHAHPELSFQERRTARVVAERMRALGLEVRTGIAGTGVLGVLRGGRPGPVVAMRGDMDALPISEETALPFASRVTAPWQGGTVGVMHACGHDIHTTILLGVAEVLTRMRAELPGTVLFIAQPAEEDGDGAEVMLREGVFRPLRPAAIFAYHVDEESPAGSIRHTAGDAAASCDGFALTVRSKGCHGADPSQCVDPIALGAQIVLDLQVLIARELDVKRHTVISVGSFHAGQAANVIPDRAELKATVRTYGEDQRRLVKARVERAVTGLCQARGATCELDYQLGTPSLYNDPALQAEILPTVARVLGGERFLIEKPPEMGGEDFSYFAREVPAVLLFLGAVPAGQKTISLHSPTVVLDEQSIPVGVEVMAQVILEHQRRHQRDRPAAKRRGARKR